MAIGEAAYLIGRWLGVAAEMRFLGDLAEGTFFAEPVHATDWIRIAQLVRRYRDFPLGTVDASVVAAAERLGTAQIATLDRRHFSVAASGFELLP
jgi:predicted nucleic acid-binding protein